ncbi:hypothetical protein [Kitasatospora sp. NBC_01266]|uniref:hypothetical protein n=1 Tax=Kitasatospora sp. NBC_01266 TaxID=2903572 RepID=UPI002E2F8634|nr:hypothetical protein [Kitasatospora sp. NBC_01266]
MTAPGPVRPKPGSAAFDGHPGGVALVLPLLGLLVALLVTLPCAGSTWAATPPANGPTNGPANVPASRPTAARTTAGHAAHAARAAQSSHTGPGASAFAVTQFPAPLTVCTVDNPGPRPGDGCSSHPFSGQEAQLPNAPPQPGPADLPLPATVRPTAAIGFASAGLPTAPAPDLHLLQVNRT